MIEANIVADSLAPCGKRLVTYICTYPRAIHSEIMTHRMLAKSSASSRAIPSTKLIDRVMDDPWIPSYIGANQRGMQAGEELPESVREQAVTEWLVARDQAVARARALLKLNVHKQVVNRILEPWMWITVIITGTEWNNFFALRDHPSAEPHFQELARKMRVARETSKPKALRAGEWHTPLAPIDAEDEAALRAFTDDAFYSDVRNRVSIGRCARVSYLTHDGRRDIDKDLELFNDLRTHTPPHAAPFEHVAMALAEPERHGNLVGWKSFRMMLDNESVPG